MNIEKYLNKISYIDNEIRNYQSESSQLKNRWQEIKQSNMSKEDKQNECKKIINRLNAIATTINEFQIEEEQINQQAFANHLLEITYGSLVEELQTLAKKRNLYVGFSNYATVNAVRLGIDIVSLKDSVTKNSYGILIPQGENPKTTFSELLKMEYSELKINIDPNAYYMEDNIICEAVHNCAKRKEKIEENNKEK